MLPGVDSLVSKLLLNPQNLIMLGGSLAPKTINNQRTHLTGAPNLTCPAPSPTARSLRIVSSLSLDLCPRTTPQFIFLARLYALMASETVPTWLTFMIMPLQAPFFPASCILWLLVDIKSSPAIWI